MFRIIVMLLLILCIQTRTLAAIVIGNPHGKVTMIAVIDYQCPYCKQDYPVIRKLIHNDPDLKVRLMPVAIINQISIYETAAAITATRYNKFHKLSQIFMAQAHLNAKGVNRILKQLELSSNKFNRLMHSKFVKQQMLEGLQFLKVESSGTPLFIIYPTHNPKLSTTLSGYQDYLKLRQVIRHAGSKL
ncbi:MAG: hypothetical protein COB50_03460 [Thiotrichales bacterium]|nr:MAG: hypothetical protein COB50_03460 [Thiotrichales bacterium]